MNRFKSVTVTKPLRWFMALLLAAFVAGCGGGGSGSSAGSSAPSSAKAITGFSLAGVTGTINETSTPKTIVVTVPSGTSVTARVATFTAPGASVMVSGVAQTSGVTANNFTSPVAYTVTAADGTTATYTVTVVPSPAIIAYSLAGVPGIIDETATPKTIVVPVPFGTNVANLAAAFTTTGTGAVVTVAAVPQTSGATPNDFTNSVIVPVAYIVTAADHTTATYNVTVTVAANFAKSITAYSIAGVIGTISETNKTITVAMPFGTVVTSLTATFTSTGTGLPTVLGVNQISGTTPNNFTNPVQYTVIAADSTTATYTVTVTVALSSDKTITAYSFASVAGTIDETAKTIAVTMPNGTNVTSLVSTFSTTGASVKVGTTVQQSGTTPNDFTSSVAYIVTAADTSTATYTVTVTVVAGPNLRRTASFAVLSTGSSITATGTTLVTGDVGATSFTGGGTLSITAGTNYSAGSGQPFVDAQTDLPSVISDANSPTQFPCGSSIAPNLSGVVLTPGVTCILANAAILNTGVVTLNGSGVYIIRTTGALTPAASSSVAFSGTATNANTTVFWVVGAANIGSPSTWMGTILTGGAVVLGDTDTLVKGRVLTTAAITLSNNTITKP
jgi:hypothetical protein